MYAAQEIIGQEVIGLPGQNLTAQELRVLVGVAEGEAASRISAAAGVDPDLLLWIERDVQRKLGARNKPHMVARGFTLGVLIPNALCLLLCVASAIELDHDFFRPRSQRRSRTGGEITRLVRTTPSTAGMGRAHYA